MLEVNEIDYCKLSVTYETDIVKINEKRNEVIFEFRDAKVPGFRPGKASIEAIKIKFKKQIEDRLRQALAEDAYHTAVHEKGFEPLGAPQFNKANLTSQKFDCEFTINTKPTFELAKYKEFELPKPEQTMSVLDLSEKMLQQLRLQNGVSLPFTEDNFIQNGDSIILDYEVMVDGVAAPELSGVKEVIKVGQSPVPEFDDNLLGMKNGETRSFEFAAPDKAPEQYRGKKLHFTVTLAMGSKHEAAPLDDELAKKLDFKDLEDLRVNVNTMAGSRVQEYEAQAIGQQIQKRLAENHDFKLPDWLIIAEAKMQAKNSKQDWETISDEEKELILKRSESAVRLSFILEKIRDKEPEAQLSDEETIGIIRDNLSKMIQNNKSDQDVDTTLKNMSQSGMLPMLVGRVRDENTMQFLIKTSKVIE